MNRRELIGAYEELVAAIGGPKNILFFGKTIIDDKKSISIHLRVPDLVKQDAFVFLENVYCLLQSQGIALEYLESEKADNFFLFLVSKYKDKYLKNYKKMKLKIISDKNMYIVQQKPLGGEKEDFLKKEKSETTLEKNTGIRPRKLLKYGSADTNSDDFNINDYHLDDYIHFDKD